MSKKIKNKKKYILIFGIIILFIFIFIFNKTESSSPYVKTENAQVEEDTTIQLNGYFDSAEYEENTNGKADDDYYAEFAVSKNNYSCAEMFLPTYNASFFEEDTSSNGQPNRFKVIQTEQLKRSGDTNVWGARYYYCMRIKHNRKTINGQSSYDYLYSSANSSFLTGPEITFSAEPNSISIGKSVKLTWSSKNAVSCSGSTYPLPESFIGPKNLSGEQTITSLQNKTTFTIKCYSILPEFNMPSYSSKSITVNVLQSVGIYNTGNVITLEPEIILPTGSGQTTPGGEEGVSAGQQINKEPVYVLKGEMNFNAIKGDKYGYFRLSKVNKPPIFCNEIYGNNMVSIMAGQNVINGNKTGKISSNNDFKGSINNLEPETAYAYCAVVSNHAHNPTQIEYGQVYTFMTAPCFDCPHTTVKTQSAREIKQLSAKLNGYFNTKREVKTFFDYRIKPKENQKAPSVWQSTKPKIATKKYGNFNAIIPFEKEGPAIKGLESNTTYQFRAVVKTITDNENTSQTFYGSTFEFTTKKGPGDIIPDTCENGIWDIQEGETGIDTGGNCNTLNPCENGYQDFGETGIDYGGECGTCEDGIENGDEEGIDQGGRCDGDCFDGEQNGNETDVDQGGRCDGTCSDEIQNGNETGVDTGGRCGDEEEGTCEDGIKNGNETEIDTGGRCSKRVIVTLTADPKTVNKGGSSTISWVAENAESCNASNPERGTGVTGSFSTGALSSTKTFRVSCIGEGGTGTASINVIVKKITVNVSANPTSVLYGGSSTISWTSTGATSCELPQKKATNTTSGTYLKQDITAEDTYTVTCTNENGEWANDSVIIKIKNSNGSGDDSDNDNADAKKRVSVSVTAEPKVIYINQKSTISWTSENATSCNLNHEDRGQGTSGSFTTDALTKNKVYTVVCVGENGSDSDGELVRVVKNKINVNIWANPQKVRKGGASTIYWKADQKADFCDSGVSGAPNSIDTSLYGAFSPINIESNKTYNIVCTGPDEAYGEDSTTITIDNRIICPAGWKKVGDDCVAIEKCPEGSTGIFPNCKIIDSTKCPLGTFGTPPDCKVRPPTGDCFDKIKNGNETGIDSGGRCETGGPGNCSDEIQNGNETGVDTGGRCGNGKNGNCSDKIKNGDETGIDTGGRCSKGGPGNCSDQIQNGNETGVDSGGRCGGEIGPEDCPFGYEFVEPNKCIKMKECPNGWTGTYPNCTFVKSCPTGFTGTYPNCLVDNNFDSNDPSNNGNNGNNEGGLEKRCPNGTTGIYPNCEEDGPMTDIEHCSNGIQDFGETGIDIGGGCGGVYNSGPNCFDGIKNGDETGVDIGGHCGDDQNNTNGEFPSCFDGIKNGDETGVDIGGHCGGGNKSNRIEIRVPDFEGAGVISGDCEDKKIKGKAIANAPKYNGLVERTWFAGKKTNTGEISLNCENGACAGELEGEVFCIDGPFVGNLVGENGDGSNNKNTDWIHMIFKGYEGLGILNGNCVNGICDTGLFSGVMPETNGKVSERWTGEKGTGPYEGECKNGNCAGTWSGIITGNNGNVMGTWEGIKEGDVAGEELYIGYEGMPNIDDIVRYHEGIEHVFIRRIMINTELARKYGYKKGDNLLYFAWDLAHKFAKAFGYVDPTRNEIRVSQPDVSAYQLRQIGDKLFVYEYYKNKIIDIRETTTVFKERNSYEYYFKRN